MVERNPHAHIAGTVSERGFARNFKDHPVEVWVEYVAVLTVCNFIRTLAQKSEAASAPVGPAVG